MSNSTTLVSVQKCDLAYSTMIICSIVVCTYLLTTVFELSYLTLECIIVKRKCER